jgi:chemotaxis protein CheX
MIQDLDELIKPAVREVFQTMLSMEMTSKDFDLAEANDGQPHVAGAVGFIGRFTGVVYIHASEPFAECITTTLLGLPPEEPPAQDMVNDAMGEMANMIVGHMKSRLSDRGMPCVLTIPSVVRGTNFSIEPVSTTKGQLYSFVSGAHHLFVEFLIKPSQAST